MAGSGGPEIGSAAAALPGLSGGQAGHGWLCRVRAVDRRGWLREALTHVPWLSDVKSRAYYAALRIARRPFEHDFRALRPHLHDRMLCIDVGANHGQSI